MSDTKSTRGWVVVLAGLGINLALGVLYAWSVVAKQLTLPTDEGGWGWTSGEASVPYAVACGVFALSMVFAGRAQDKFGPRVVAMLGGGLVGAGMLIASLATPESSWPIAVGFGVLTGLGIGLGYASVTPPAVKWFAPSRRGLITGIVVGGFGLASVYIAPLTSWLLKQYAVDGTFRILGIAFFVSTVLLATLLKNPPAGYVPAGVTPPAPADAGTAAQGTPAAPAATKPDYDWRDMTRTPQFFLLWSMYALSAFAGLMIIGHAAKIAAAQLDGINLGFMLVALLAVGNATGRIAWGTVADKVGGLRAMLFIFLGQILAMGALWMSSSVVTLLASAALIGFLYGGNLSVFPSVTSHFFGTKHMGVNYGLVFTAWGVGGVFGAMAAGAIVDATGTYAAAYAIAAVLSAAAAGLSLLTKEPSH